jgi:hypothetical protein
MSEHELFALIELTDVELKAVYGGTTINTTRSNIKNARGSVAVLNSGNMSQSESITTQENGVR